MPGTSAARLQVLRVVVIITDVAVVVAMASAPGHPMRWWQGSQPHLQQGLQLLDPCEKRLPELVLLSA